MFYSEVKSLVAALGPTLAIIVGAWIGFRGVRDTQLANAALARDQFDAEIAREARRNRKAARDLARAFAAELRAGSKNFRSMAAVVRNLGKKGKKYDLGVMRTRRAAPVELFRAQLPKIGLLGALASETVEVYESFRMINQFDDDLLRGLEAGQTPMDAATFDVKLRWENDASKAEALADRLEAYEPPND